MSSRHKYEDNIQLKRIDGFVVFTWLLQFYKIKNHTVNIVK